MGSIRKRDKLGALQHSGGNITLAPSILTIGGRQFETSSTLVVALPSLTANARYQVYAVLNAGVVELVISQNENSAGPTGYSAWKLVGSFLSDVSSVFGEFININLPKPIILEVYLDSNQVIGSTGDTQILLDTVVKDTGDGWDSVNNEYVFPEEGDYEISGAAAETSTIANSRMTVRLDLDATTVSQDRHSTGATANTNTNFLTEKTTFVAAGQVLGLYCSNSDDSSYNISGGPSSTYMTVRRVSGGTPLKDL